MKAIGIIPARWASTRFEGKILALINGKPMIQHVWERASKSARLEELIIACDDERVVEAAKQFGAQVVLTSTGHMSGTDRIAEVADSKNADIVINIQGDEPLINPQVIDALVQALIDDPECQMATAVKSITDKPELDDPNVVKVVIDGDFNTLYFSRSPIPFNRDHDENIVYYKHLGIYSYRRDFLLMYAKLPKANLEQAEKLEQLRALEFGYRIKAVITDVDTVGVDTVKDLVRVEKLLKQVST